MSNPVPVDAVSAANAAAITLALPALTGVQVDDLIVVFTDARNNMGAGNATSSGGGAFTTLNSGYYSTAVAGYRAQYRFADSSDIDSVITVRHGDSSSKQIAGVALVIRGVDPTTPINASLFQDAASSTGANPVGLTTTVADCLFLMAFFAQDNTKTLTPIAGTTVQEDAKTGVTTTGARMIVASGLESASRAIPAQTYSVGFSASMGVRRAMIAIAPDPTPPPTDPTWTEWDGAAETDLSVDGIWNGATIDPFGVIEVT